MKRFSHLVEDTHNSLSWLSGSGCKFRKAEDVLWRFTMGSGAFDLCVTGLTPQVRLSSPNLRCLQCLSMYLSLLPCRQFKGMSYLICFKYLPYDETIHDLRVSFSCCGSVRDLRWLAWLENLPCSQRRTLPECSAPTRPVVYVKWVG